MPHILAFGTPAMCVCRHFFCTVFVQNHYSIFIVLMKKHQEDFIVQIITPTTGLKTRVVNAKIMIFRWNSDSSHYYWIEFIHSFFSFQEPVKKRSKLVLPAPQISEAELEEVDIEFWTILFSCGHLIRICACKDINIS